MSPTVPTALPHRERGPRLRLRLRRCARLGRELLAVTLAAVVVELLLHTTTLDRTSRRLGIRLDLSGDAAGPGADGDTGHGPAAPLGSPTALPEPGPTAPPGGPTALPEPGPTAPLGSPTAPPEPGPTAPPEPAPLPGWTHRVLRATDTVLGHWPFRDTCLRRSLVLGWRLRSLSPVLRLGVAEQDGAYQAHAWLVVAGRSIDPAAADFSTLVAA